jgi:hypothetical protein
MTIPGAERAVIAVEKLTEYLLNSNLLIPNSWNFSIPSRQSNQPSLRTSHDGGRRRSATGPPVTPPSDAAARRYETIETVRRL